MMDHLESGKGPSAREFAIAAHGAQLYGDQPYSFHLDQVADLAQQFGPVAVDVAYLHDTEEDTATTLEDLRQHFGELVAGCVDLLSDPPGANRRERKAKAYARLAGVVGPLELALKVKLCDRLANVRACVADKKRGLWELYKGEHLSFKAAAFRPGAGHELWAELDELLSDGMFEKLTEAKPPEVQRG